MTFIHANTYGTPMLTDMHICKHLHICAYARVMSAYINLSLVNEHLSGCICMKMYKRKRKGEENTRREGGEKKKDRVRVNNE